MKKISKITKKQMRDICIRTVKTFVAAGLTAVTALPAKDNLKVVAIAFGSAGITAIWNMVIKAFEESEE